MEAVEFEAATDLTRLPMRARDRWADTLPPAVVNEPPTYRSGPKTARLHTEPPIPEPSALQLLPFPLAMFAAGNSPATVKLPPAYRSLPDTASAYTVPAIPEPSALQLLPFHLAIFEADSTPATVKSPPAYRSLPDTANACTR